MVGLAAGSSLRRWIETHVGPRAPAVRYRTTVAGLNQVVALAAAGVGLAVVPRRTIDPEAALDLCELQDPWAHRDHLLAWGVKDDAPRAAATGALARHLREAALSEPLRQEPDTLTRR